MALRFPKIYPITDTRLSGLSHADQVAQLIDGGATLIQLREKIESPRIFLRAAEAALVIAEKQNVQIIINDRADIAAAIGCAGVHLGQSDIPVEATRRLLPDAVIGLSTHDLPQVEIAARLPLDYVAFGPVFATSTKADHEAVVGLDLLRRAKDIVGELPLVAIGGISEANCRDALRAGADSVAVISAVLAEPAKIATNMARMLALTQS